MTTLRRVLRPAFGLALLAAVLLTVNPDEVAGRLEKAQVGTVGLAIIGLSATHLIAAAAWRLILARLGDVRLSWRAAARLFYAAQAIGALTPANLGGDVHRAVALNAAGHGPRASVSPLLVQRAMSYAALGMLSVAALVPIAGRAEAAVPFVIFGCAFAVAIFVALGVVVLPGPFASLRARALRLFGLPGAAPISSPVAELAKAGAIGLVLGFAFHAAAIAWTWLLLGAVDPGLPAVPVLAALAIARLSLAVPFTPSGLGIQEGALALLFGQLGMSPETALAGMLLARLSIVLTTAVGAFFLVRPGPLRSSGDPSTISTHPAPHRG